MAYKPQNLWLIFSDLAKPFQSGTDHRPLAKSLEIQWLQRFVIMFALDDVLVLFKITDMTQTIDTLGKALRHNMLVVATCRECQNQGRFMAKDLATFYGHGRDPFSLKFRCKHCDTRNCKVTIMDNPYDRTPETIVWRPVKVKL